MTRQVFDVDDAEARGVDFFHRRAQKERRRSALPAWIAGWEEGADIASADCAEQGIGDGVQQHVAVRVAGEAFMVLDRQAADNQRDARLERV